MITGSIEQAALSLRWVETPWDSTLFGSPVLNVAHIDCLGPPGEAARAFGEFEDARAQVRCRFSSVRVPAHRMKELLLLQERRYYVVETLYHPTLALAGGALPVRPESDPEPVLADLVRSGPIDTILEIAGSAFGLERFHADPRLPRGLGDQRYRNWVDSALTHPRQRLYALRHRGQCVGFFVIEFLDDGTCYWHLNALAPSAQGRGLGAKAWAAMIGLARAEGASRVRSAIVGRNTRVMQLYVRLGFRLEDPQFGLHWFEAVAST